MAAHDRARPYYHAGDARAEPLRFPRLERTPQFPPAGDNTWDSPGFSRVSDGNGRARTRPTQARGRPNGASARDDFGPLPPIGPDRVVRKRRTAAEHIRNLRLERDVVSSGSRP